MKNIKNIKLIFVFFYTYLMTFFRINANNALICVSFMLTLFTIYLLKLYFSKSKKKPVNNNVILFLIIMCIIYIIILSWFIKIPSFKPYYLYSCFPVRIVPIPKPDEPRCSDIVIFNLTSQLIENHVINVKPRLAYSSMNYLNDIQNPCLLEKNTIFLYYCMEYGETNDLLYYIMVKNGENS